MSRRPGWAWARDEGGSHVSRRFRLILALACCVLAAALFLMYASQVRKEADRVRAETLARYGGEVVSLAVARVGLEPGDVVTPSNVEMREWLAEMAPEGAIVEMDEVAGREVSVAAAKGAPLTGINFRDANQVADVPQGHVAVSIPVTDKLGVSRSVAVGSALLAYQVKSDGVDLIARDMTVLASASAMSSLSSSVQLTVAVLPEDVPQVLAASASNDLRLVMPAKGEAAEATGAVVAAPEAIAADGLAGADAGHAEGDDAADAAGATSGGETDDEGAREMDPLGVTR